MSDLTVEQAQERKDRMIEAVRDWLGVVALAAGSEDIRELTHGRYRPSDEAIWEAWRTLTREAQPRGVYPIEVSRYLVESFELAGS